MSGSNWMLYGANGYTGRLIAEEAAAGESRPILAGRNGRQVAALAERFGCESRIFSLESHGRIVEQLRNVKAVLHCAGPFSATAAPMMDACLAAGTDYLDITGEVDVIEAAATRHQRALQAGVCLIPAVGFDVVPSDCLAAMLARRLPKATHLQLAFSDTGAISRGTAATILEALPYGGRARVDGRIVKVPAAWKSRAIPFRSGTRPAVTIPWGDVASAWYSTGIPNIEVYTSMPRRQIQWLRRLRPLLGLLRVPPLPWLLRRAVRRLVAGPSAEQRRASRASFWGCVSDEAGRYVEATLETPGGYRLTVATALAAMERTLHDKPPMGFSTPAVAFGADFILDIPEADYRQGKAGDSLPKSPR